MRKITLEELKTAYFQARKNKKPKEDTAMTVKKFLRFEYGAIKRYGDKAWTVGRGTIEFNTNYVVSCGVCETAGIGTDDETGYIVELSNGTKFLAFFRECDHEILSPGGELANEYISEAAYESAERYAYKLNH